MNGEQTTPRGRWLNRTVLGIGLASLFSDWSHEIATTAMPAFLATMGVAAAWLGLIEGVSDGVSSFAKMAGGFCTDRLRRRKPIAVAGYVATALMGFVVKERERKPVPHVSFGESLRALPPRFRRFLVAVGLFGAGDFAHTLLILLAAQKLAPALGAAKAASVATGLYVLHNVLYATLSMVAGWLADRFNKGPLLAAGYFLAALMALSYQASSLARYGRRSTHRSRSPTAHSCLLQAAGWF